MRPITPSLALLFGLLSAAPTARSAEGPAAVPATQPAVRVKPAADGSVLLHAKDVSVHGTTVRYEPQPNKNTVGYWMKKDDWVSWEFETAKAGRYHVLILQGCGKGSGGAEVQFTVAAAAAAGEAGKEGQVLKTTVQDTGGFQNFVSRDIGTIDLSAGVYTLSVKPLSKPGVAVMDLRSVTLKPGEGKQEKEQNGDNADKADKADKAGDQK